MEQKIGSAYDQMTTQLQELHNAYAQTDDNDDFQRKLGKFRIQYSNRSTILRRIEKLSQ